ncbi:MAG: type II secretion system protein GspG [Desulfobacteraceae bacterium]
MFPIISAFKKRACSLRKKNQRKKSPRQASKVRGFTIFELMVVLAIIGTLATIALSAYSRFIDKAQITRAISDIRNIDDYLEFFFEDNDKYPDTLDELGMGPFIDPWGNPYQYVNIATAHHKYWRRDRNNKPINSKYDLWSNGADGRTQINVNAKKARDDIIRAWDGSFIGLGGEFDDLHFGKKKKG